MRKKIYIVDISVLYSPFHTLEKMQQLVTIILTIIISHLYIIFDDFRIIIYNKEKTTVLISFQTYLSQNRRYVQKLSLFER